jgi:hypothetical protein
MESMYLLVGMVVGWIVCYIQMKYGKDIGKK